MSKVIKIGKDYKNAFDSVLSLYEEGFIPASIVENADVESKTIYYKDDVFVYSETESDEDEKTIAEITTEGSSWFASVRNQSEDKGSFSDWLQLIQDVSEECHRSNSFLEYTQKKRVISQERRKVHVLYARKFCRVFFPEAGVCTVVPNNNSDMADLFCVSCLLEVNGGAGETQKLLTKVFLKLVGDKLVPIPIDESVDIVKQINNTIDDVPSPITINNPSGVITRVLTRLDMLCNDENLKDYMLLNSKRDESIINEIIKKGQQGSVEVNCSYFRVLSINHIKWPNNTYKVLNEGKEILNVSFNSKDQISVRCARCGNKRSSILVTDNTISYLEGKKGQEVQRTFNIDFAKDNLGLSVNQIVGIKTKSYFALHFIVKNNCTNVGFGIKTGCRRIVCRKDLINYEGEICCVDCPYPKKVFIDDNGAPHLTKAVAYVSDRHTLIEKDVTVQCSICRRTFTKSFLGNSNECPNCRRLAEAGKEANKETWNVYNKYKNLFNVGFRAISSAKVHLAYEDSEVVVFKIDRTFYLVSKLDFVGKGYLASPKKL